MNYADSFSRCISKTLITLSMPLPCSAQMLIQRMKAARSSLQNRGGSSMNRIVSIRGIPGLVISIRAEKLILVMRF
jgi:hypothetical protein